MRQKLSFQFIFLLILTLGGVFGIHYFAQATTGVAVDVYVDGILLDHENPIFQETNWTPGDSITKTVELRNLTDEYVNVDLLITKQESGILEKKLKITIRDWNDDLIYGPKTLEEFFGNSIMAFPNIGPGLGTTNTYKFTIEFPPADNSDDNKYNYNDKNEYSYVEGAQCNTIFDLQFHFEGTETTENPPGHGVLEWFWQNMNLATGEAIISGISKIATSPIKKFAQAVKLPAKLPRVGAWGGLIAASMGLIATVAVHRRNKKQKIYFRVYLLAPQSRTQKEGCGAAMRNSIKV